MATISNHANPALSGHLSGQETRLAKKLASDLEDLIVLRRKYEEAETNFKIKLKDILKPAYFSFNEDARNAEDITHTFDLDNLQVNFTNAYFIKDNQHLQTVVKLLGANHPLVDTIKESAKISVDVTNLSNSEANSLASELTKVAVNYGVKPTVERKAIATQEFHDLRHVYLSAADNIELDKELPLVIQVAPIK